MTKCISKWHRSSLAHKDLQQWAGSPSFQRDIHNCLHSALLSFTGGKKHYSKNSHKGKIHYSARTEGWKRTHLHRGYLAEAAVWSLTGISQSARILRILTTHRSVAGGSKSFSHALLCTSKDITTCSHSPANQHWLASQLQGQTKKISDQGHRCPQVLSLYCSARYKEPLRASLV